MLILAVMIIRILPAILNFFLLKIVTVRITTAVFQKLVDKFFSLLIRHSRLRNESGHPESRVLQKSNFGYPTHCCLWLNPIKWQLLDHYQP